MPQPFFKRAKPVWLKGLSEAMNVQAGFRAVFRMGRGTCMLRVAGASVYRIRLNGRFVGHGPARCGHGFYRVDEWKLPVTAGENLLSIEVAGYNANSFAYLDQPSFLQAEVRCGERILAATGGRGFSAYRLRERIQKVQRYSFQRTFVEAYRLGPRSQDWQQKLVLRRKADEIEVLAPRSLVDRSVGYPVFGTRQPVATTARGTVRPAKSPKLRMGREWSGPRDNFKAFPANSQTLYPAHELESRTSTVRSHAVRAYQPERLIELKPNGFRVLDFGINLTGFIGLHVDCDAPVDLYLAFDELATDHGDVSIVRYGCANVVKYSLKPGSYDLETLEPYTLKYLKVLAVNGCCRISSVYIREYACARAQKARFASSDEGLNLLFEAARQTFRQNAVDIFMDCPGRERAGWLCDSFFTARAEHVLCGDSEIERNFFENFLLPKRYPHMPKGMLPMCYPADHTDGTFIPNWAMWFVIELQEYLKRRGDRALVDALQAKVYGLIDYFKAYLNRDRLLENLDRWVFIEWSKANSFTQDVNYPSNMLYAGMLDAAGALYDDAALIAQAQKVRKAIRRQSFDGEYFADNALRREDGSLQVTTNRTETCQYYAFFFNVATPSSHGALWETLCADFGPGRDSRTEHPEIHPSNAFIGFFLRLEVLSRYGRKALVLDQLYQSYLPMALKTGTLWEHKDTSASCNHGFASHVAHILVRDVLGIQVDPVAREVSFSVPDGELAWCEATIPIGNEWIAASWHRGEGGLETSLALPRGYRVIQSG